MSSAENLSLEPSLEALVTHLVAPLLLPPPQLSSLKASLSTRLATIFAPTWHTADPHRGSAYRSLIAVGGRLPRPLREAAAECAVDLARWEALLGEHGEWQVWCDPGRVSVREGGWEWEDGVFYLGGWKGECCHPSPLVFCACLAELLPSSLSAPCPLSFGLLLPGPDLGLIIHFAHILTPFWSSLLLFPPVADTLRTVWAAPSPLALSTTPRLSHAITIRSPCAQVIPASPLPTVVTLLTPPTPQSEPPLPPLSERPDSPAGSESSASTFTSAVSNTSSSHPNIVRPHSHAHHSSISSIDSARTRSTSPSKKPSVTAYDGGKVGVLGGGVKLGGGASAPTSPKKQHSAYTSFNHHLAAGGPQQQQQQRGRKMVRQPGLFAVGPNQHMGPPPMGLFAYRG